ncbi:MAG: subclass B1 metallo-beta-lactamase [Bacteroidales bacterium]|nr:subclass B1 metallo-beta-lactamase [Bacteroidales bacterium]
MKRTLIFIIIGFIQFYGYSQGFDTIKVTKDIELIKISPSAYVHISYKDVPSYGRVPANGMILINNNEAFIFDTPWTDSLTNDLLQWIKNKMQLKIVGFIPNDWHWDSMGGLKLINDLGVPTYANEMTKELAQKKGLPVPKNGFIDSLALKFGKFDICCYYFGAAHTIDNIVVWIPSEKILFADCMIKELKAKDLGFTGDGDVNSYGITVKRVMDKFKSIKYVVPGHGDIGGKDLIEHTLELTKKK